MTDFITYYKSREDMTATDLRDQVREMLIEIDNKMTDLGLDLMHKWEWLTGDSCGWDPDAYYTPLENQHHKLAAMFGLDYNKDIAAEAYRRRKEAHQ